MVVESLIVFSCPFHVLVKRGNYCGALSITKLFVPFRNLEKIPLDRRRCPNIFHRVFVMSIESGLDFVLLYSSAVLILSWDKGDKQDIAPEIFILCFSDFIQKKMGTSKRRKLIGFCVLVSL